MNQLLFRSGPKSSRDLNRDFQRFHWVQRSCPLHVCIDGFAIDELHRVEIALVIGAQMKDGSNVLMSKRSRSASLPQKSLPSDITIQIGVIDDLQGDRTSKIRVESLVGDAHGAPA